VSGECGEDISGGELYSAAFVMDSDRPLRFTFVSGNRAWGGSEELWSAAAAVLAADGHRVTVYKSCVSDSEPRIRALRELSCSIHDLARFPLSPRRLFSGLGVLSRPLTYAHEVARLGIGVGSSKRPDLVVISQGGNHDGYLLADVCRRLRLPYVLISQKASDLYWPPDLRRASIRRVFESARATYFVSQHNLRLTEEQFGIALPSAKVVRNPFLVPWQRRDDWPDESRGVRLACVGRLDAKEKGQDLLLRVLARDRWRARPLSVTFYGTGLHARGLEQMAQHLGLTSVTFAGFVRDVTTIWDDHHGLVLASRCEGLPLVLVEAMLSGRIAIVTDAGGNAEILEDGITGFLATASSEDALDAALDRAWTRRPDWPTIATTAADHIRTLIPEDPASVFAALLRDVARNA
jgi:glycosyltransferase involved in cell wall biosynthesis